MPELPEADVLIHAGDWLNSGTRVAELFSFTNWLDGLSIPVDRRLVVAGNHDILLDGSHRNNTPENARESRRILSKSCTYLESEEIVVEGVKFYFSPYTPAYFGWAFNADEDKLRKEWAKIPDDTDVLVTHGPPLDILDQASPSRWSMRIGDKILRDRVLQIKPKIHVFGHIHGSRGVLQVGETTHVNASFVQENYVPYPGKGYFMIELNDGTVEVLNQ
jgi:Icc-related predicted phosphoesterase